MYAEKAYYKIVGPYYTTKGSITPAQSIPVPTYCAEAASGMYIFKFWLIDVQLPTSIAIGSATTTVPTAYGLMTAYGPGAMVQARAYSTSSGAGSGQAITCWVTKS